MIELNINGRTHAIDADPHTPLLYVLRDHLALSGAKFGCGLGQCGACTVIINGTAVRSCSYAVSAAQGKKITTLEGLGNVQHPHVLQKAFIEEQAAQCGFCMNGIIMTAKVLLDKNRHPPRPNAPQNIWRTERSNSWRPIARSLSFSISPLRRFIFH